MSNAETLVRDFVAQFPTPQAYRALALCEAGTLAWSDVAAIFERSLKAALNG